MARYTGPATKKARAFGEAIYGEDKYFERKKFPPGQHGPTRKKKHALTMERNCSKSKKLNIRMVFWSVSSEKHFKKLHAVLV